MQSRWLEGLPLQIHSRTLLLGIPEVVVSQFVYMDEDCNTFVREIEQDGRWQIRDYSGRFYWQGPAVFCDKSEFQDVVRATSVRVQTDDWGKTGMIVYPVSHGGPLLDPQESGAEAGGHQGEEAGGASVPEAPSAASTRWPGPRGAEVGVPYPFTAYLGEGEDK